MSFLGALLAMLWDQLSPLHRPTQFERLFGQFAVWLLPRFNAGTASHAYFAWAVAAAAPALLAAAVGLLLSGIYLAALVWGALLVYQCMGLRQLAEVAKGIGAAFRSGEAERVRTYLADLGLDSEGVGDGQLDRIALNQVFVQGLRRGFGVLFWFVLLGSGGALLYALSAALANHWRHEAVFRQVTGQVMAWLDWLPVRLVMLSFALVGNFEETLQRWRGQEEGTRPDDLALLADVGAGALGLGAHASAEAAPEAAAVLLKRAVALWLAVLGLFWLGTI
jgi:adenosylcobinamide-phosphate synthase